MPTWGDASLGTVALFQATVADIRLVEELAAAGLTPDDIDLIVCATATPDHTYTAVREAADVTDEILAIAESIEEGWYGGGARIDWDDLVNRLDGSALKDGTRVDMGGRTDTPAIRKIQRHIRAQRAAG